MSLTTLTFSSATSAQSNTASKGTIQVLKTDQFYGTEGICVIGRLVNGAVSREMIVSGTDKKVLSVESNYGEGCCAHKGAQVVLMVTESEKDDFVRGDQIAFEKIAIVSQVRPKGRLIIA